MCVTMILSPQFTLLMAGARMKSRGDTGQAKSTEETLEEIKLLHAKVDALMAHLSVSAVTTWTKCPDEQ